MSSPHRPDPVVAIVVALLVMTAIGLLMAAILAVYTWATPDGEGPVIGITAGVFGLACVVSIAAAVWRRWRRG